MPLVRDASPAKLPMHELPPMNNPKRVPMSGDRVRDRYDGVFGVVRWKEGNTVYVNFDDCSYSTYTLLDYQDAYNFYEKCEFFEQEKTKL